MPDPVTLRLAEPADAGAIAALIAVLASDLGEPSAVTAGYVVKVVDAGTCQVLLAERSGEVLAMVSFSYNPSFYHAADSCLIHELVVSPVRGTMAWAPVSSSMPSSWHRRTGASRSHWPS